MAVDPKAALKKAAKPKAKRASKRPKKVTYVPRNPSKYDGSYPIILRSSWEVAFAQRMDMTETVIKWSSESVKIPYKNPVKNTQSIYIPDFLITVITPKGEIETKLIEIKPEKEAFAEKQKNTHDAVAYLVNQAKWAAASAWCTRRGIKFEILTETGMFVNTAPTQVRKPKPKKGLKATNKATKKPTTITRTKTTGIDTRSRLSSKAKRVARSRRVRRS